LILNRLADSLIKDNKCLISNREYMLCYSAVMDATDNYDPTDYSQSVLQKHKKPFKRVEEKFIEYFNQKILNFIK